MNFIFLKLIDSKKQYMLKHPWIIFIIINSLNAFSILKRNQPHIDEKPERKQGYQKAFLYFLLFGNLPFIIMAWGMLSGMTNNIFDFLNLSQLNPIVSLFYISILFTWLLIIKFIFFNRGIKFLNDHPGIIYSRGLNAHTNTLDETTVKIMTIILTIGYIIAMIVLWNIDFSGIIPS